MNNSCRLAIVRTKEGTFTGALVVRGFMYPAYCPIDPDYRWLWGCPDIAIETAIAFLLSDRDFQIHVKDN